MEIIITKVIITHGTKKMNIELVEPYLEYNVLEVLYISVLTSQHLVTTTHLLLQNLPVDIMKVCARESGYNESMGASGYNERMRAQDRNLD